MINRLNPRHETDYFRRSFTVGDADAYESIDLRMVIDDGAIVYINGEPVTYYNMPQAPLPPGSALASSGIWGAQESAIISRTVQNPPLVDGVNWIAVEVHQATTNSSDTSFDLELRKHDDLPPSNFNVLGSASNDGIALDFTWSAVPGATEYRLYRRDLLGATLDFVLVETWTSGTSGAYVPDERKAELADYRLASVVNGQESVPTYAERIAFAQDINKIEFEDGYAFGKGTLDVTATPAPTASAAMATAIPLAAGTKVTPFPHDDAAVLAWTGLLGGLQLLSVWVDADYMTMEGVTLDRDSLDPSTERVNRSKGRAKEWIKNALIVGFGISAADGRLSAQKCIDDIDAAWDSGVEFPGQDSDGLINGEPEPVKEFETHAGYLFCMSASRDGSLIQATVGSLGGVGRRPRKRSGFAA